MKTEKNRLLMQLHITSECNLSCKHCYQENKMIKKEHCPDVYRGVLSFDDIVRVVEQFCALALIYNKDMGINKKAHINLTGGEPLTHPQIFRIFDFLGSNCHRFSWALLSNGTLIDENAAVSLEKNRVSFVQMSIDGNKKTHDYLRADGNYRRTFNTAGLLKKHNIKTYISFTANRLNYKYLPSVARMCRHYGVNKLWSDRLVPIGDGEKISDLVITKDIMPKYIRSLKKAQGLFLTKKFYPKTEVAIERSLQFINTGSNIYSCSAGKSFLTVDENGNVMPCRRMPIVCGNVFDTSLTEVYYNSEVFKNLRRPQFPKECANCIYSVLCKGGARCQSYALYKDYMRSDPACPLANLK